MTAQLGVSGTFCGNPTCADYARVGAGNLRRYGKTPAGVQRYQCRTCRVTFVATKGTPFCGCHTPLPTILECLALVAERMSLAAIHRVKGIKEETVAAWLAKAAAHGAEIEALLLAHYPLTPVQVDALWTYVGHKGAKGGTRKRAIGGPSGGGSRSRRRRGCASGGRWRRRNPTPPSRSCSNSRRGGSR